ncbi:Lrp/AsnC family transcriptional regulator [Patescibacteria group bacterium]|nr:Lrp/AsnC family transcriptional regulator [Patescibacteria group bacterium]
MTNLLEFEPIKKFIATIGEDIAQYLGKDDTVILCLRPEGPFYGEALKIWLKQKGKKNVIVVSMEDDGADLDEKLVRGRKVLIVNSDVVTGKSYKRSTEALRVKKKDWNIKDIKFAVFFDRVGVADFSVAKYSAEAIWHMDEMDAIDLKIISYLSQDGREALAEIGKKVRLSSVAVKNRLDKLFKEKILRVRGSLNIDQFYTMSAQIQLEADEKTVGELIEKFGKMQEVYYLVRTTSGRYNLILGVLARNLDNIKDFLESEIRIVTGVRRIDVYVGELPITPKTVHPQF